VKVNIQWLAGAGNGGSLNEEMAKGAFGRNGVKLLSAAGLPSGEKQS